MRRMKFFPNSASATGIRESEPSLKPIQQHHHAEIYGHLEQSWMREPCELVFVMFHFKNTIGSTILRLLSCKLHPHKPDARVETPSRALIGSAMP